MSAGCGCSGARFDGLSPGYRKALWAVIALNAIMFVVEMTAGWLAGSRALQADALDFLSDTATYSLSLVVIGMAPVVRARAALVKGISLVVMGFWVLGSTVHAVVFTRVPEAEVMGIIGALALAVNLGAVLLLMRWRQGDANVRSVWLCSRNDAIGNVAVLIAAAGVWGTGTPWPDLIVAGIMASLFLWSAVLIIAQARGELAEAAAAPSAVPATGGPPRP